MQTNITHISQLDITKSYTVGDYLSWKFDEMVELIKGKIYNISPAPRSKHQAYLHNLDGIFYNLTRKRTCKVFPAPFDVYLKGMESDQDTVVQPDICIVCDQTKISEFGCVGSPDMIIEILSPSTMKKDLEAKFQLYEENGVNEYWIIAPENLQVSVYTLGIDKLYIHRGDFLMNQNVPVYTLKEALVKINDIFEF